MIMQVLREIIFSIVGCDEFTTESLLKNDIGLDSMSMVDLIVKLEEKFLIRFNDSDLDPSLITSVRDILELVGKYL